MTANFRALCAELADALDNAIRIIYCEDGTLHISTAKPVLQRARAALAEPQPAADGEVAELVVSEIVRNLRTKAATEKANACHYSATLLTRAAELLERLSDGPAVQSRKPASVATEPSDEEMYDYWISTSPEFGCADPVGFARAVLARWGTPNLAETRSSLEPSGEVE
jgi:hypothetical protein